ncbi:Bug family tripartite tricarboxylate transporter substrate binding protein [Paralcaligenes ginsengisoli]
MKITRRFLSAATLAIAPLATGTAGAEQYPTHPITLIQQFAPGGGSDAVARPLAPELGRILGQSIVIDSKPGANGVIANQFVAQSKPDGYTLLFASAGPMTAAPHLYKLRVDPLKAFIPVALVVKTPSAIIVNDTVKVSTLKELVALAKQNPGHITYGTSGVGGAPHLAGEMLSAATGAKFLPVAYKGMGPAMTAVLSGEVNFAFADIAFAVPLIQSGRVKALATTGQKRSPILPEVPTAQEAGVPGYQSSTWYAIFAPKGTPDAVVKRLHDAVNQALAGDLSKRYTQLGMDPANGMSQQAFADFVKAEYDRFGNIIKKANIKIER